MVYLSDEDIRKSLLAKHSWVLPIDDSRSGIKVSPYGDPRNEGPVCVECAPGWLDTLARAAQLKEPYGKSVYGAWDPSPHYYTYLKEARYQQWACVSGRHGRINFNRS